MGKTATMLTISEVSVKFGLQKGQNDPPISTLDVKVALNIVNMPEDTPIFPL